MLSLHSCWGYRYTCLPSQLRNVCVKMGIEFQKGFMTSFIVIGLIFFFVSIVQLRAPCSNCAVCVSSPLNELMTTLSRAQGGIVATSQTICLLSGEAFTSEALQKKVSGVRTITFSCFTGASVCTGTGAPISVTDARIESNGAKTEFRAQISCTRTASDDFDCTLQVKNPPS